MRQTAICLLLAAVTGIHAQQVNDNNTPLHLMKPAYRLPYGIPKADEVKQTIDRVLINSKTGKTVDRLKDIDEHSQLKQGGFRLTSYEWGVTYSGVLAAYEATGDPTYRDYVYTRHRLLADIAPWFQKIYQKGKKIDGNVRRVIDPHALDDAGAVCASMIKARLKDATLPVDGLIKNYADYIMNKEYRLADGTFARLRPQKNTVWLDDMFMGIPALAYMGKYTGEPTSSTPGPAGWRGAVARRRAESSWFRAARARVQPGRSRV